MAHRFIVGETPAAALGVLRGLWDRGVASSVDLLGEATVTAAEADRYAARCAEALEELAQARRALAAAARSLEHDSVGPLPRANVSVKVSALTPLLRPDAPEIGPPRRRRTAAAAAAPGARSRRPHPHRHGVARLPRGGARAGARAALRGGVRDRAVGRASCSRPTCATRPSSSTRSSTGRGPSDAHAAAAGPARQGRLLGPRARPGAPARLAGAGVRGQGRLRPQLRGADPAAARRPPGGPRRGRLAQPALGRARDRRQPAARRRGPRPRAPGPARPRRRAPGRAGHAAASASAPTARSATSWPGWPTSCGACSRTRATSRSCHEQARGVPLETLLAAP